VGRYWWIVLLATLIGLGIQDYRYIKQPVRYVSYSRMMASGHLSIPQDAVYSEQLEYFYGTQIALMKSPETISQAIDRVSAIHPEVTVDPSADVEAGIEIRTTIFDLRVSSTNPEYAKLLLDAVMDTYLSSKRGRRNQTTDEAVSAITEEISHLNAEIGDDEQQLLDFQKENDVVFIEEQSQNSATYLVGLNNDLARLTKEHDLLSLEDKDPRAIPSDNGTTGDTNAAPEPAAPGGAGQDFGANIISEQENIEKLKILRDEYSVYLKDMHPKMIQLADQIDNEQKFLDLLKTRDLTAREARREDLELQIKNLEQQIVLWNKKSLDLSQRLGTYQQLEGKLKRDQALYNQLASSIQNVDLNKMIDQENVIIMEAASKAVPADPDFIPQMAYGLGGGLLAGCLIVFFVSRLDNKIHSPLELQENVEFPLVGQIPFVLPDKKTKRLPLLSDDDERHTLLESYRSLRSAIFFRPLEGAKPRSLMICSAIPGEGKSTLASNLAILIALAGSRVLLIDADLRRGVLHALFELPLSPGLSDYLREEIHWRDTVKQTTVANLDVIPRGKVPRQAGDLLLGSAADLLLQESIAEYDMVLWDSAPLLAADDAANLCSKVDGMLFVARVGTSSINSVRSCLEEFSQRNAKIIGIVLNAVKPHQPGYYDKYRYKEYYSVVAEV
jgi:capsular exopolysaccharide synthesis family protein